LSAILSNMVEFWRESATPILMRRSEMDLDKYKKKHVQLLGIANPEVFLEKALQECLPNQFVREFTQNSIDAFCRSKTKGEVLWGRMDIDGTEKLFIADNGPGMSPKEMLLYLGNLSASGSDLHDVDHNFGMGAKLSAIAGNRHGVIYVSWQKNKPFTVVWKHCGMVKSLTGPGNPLNVAKPSIIKDHGVLVIFMGESKTDNTARKSGYKDEQAGMMWVARYLNERYFELPAGVKIVSKVGETVTTVKGQKKILGQNSISSGTVNVGNALVDWWILKERKKSRVGSPAGASWLASGHFAIRHQDKLTKAIEIYEKDDARKSLSSSGHIGRSKLASFGILVGAGRVAIHVTPQFGSPSLHRNQILQNGRPIDVRRIGAVFAQNMPAQLRTFLQSQQPKELGLKRHANRVSMFVRKLGIYERLIKLDPNGPIWIVCPPPKKPPKPPKDEESERASGGGKPKGQRKRASHSRFDSCLRYQFRGKTRCSMSGEDVSEWLGLLVQTKSGFGLIFLF